MKNNRTDTMARAIGELDKIVKEDPKSSPQETKNLFAAGMGVLATALDCLASIADSLETIAYRTRD